MTGLVLATPRRNKLEQYIKRVFRLGSDVRITRHVYDIVDKRLSVQSQWYSRAAYYRNAGFLITDMEFDDNELDSISATIRPAPARQ